MMRLGPTGKFLLGYLVVMTVLVFLISKAIGDPYLKSDCAEEEDISYYLITGLGKDGIQFPYYLDGECKRLSFDLQHLTPGQYDATIQACDTSDNCSTPPSRYQIVVSVNTTLEQYEMNTSIVVREITILGVEPDWEYISMQP